MLSLLEIRFQEGFWKLMSRFGFLSIDKILEFVLSTVKFINQLFTILGPLKDHPCFNWLFYLCSINRESRRLAAECEVQTVELGKWLLLKELFIVTPQKDVTSLFSIQSYIPTQLIAIYRSFGLAFVLVLDNPAQADLCSCLTFIYLTL